MKEFEEFNKLNPYDRALLATAILIDGREAVDYLKSDTKNGELYKKIVEALGKLEPELRFSLMGTFLREALSNLKYMSKENLIG